MRYIKYLDKDSENFIGATLSIKFMHSLSHLRFESPDFPPEYIQALGLVQKLEILHTIHGKQLSDMELSRSWLKLVLNAVSIVIDESFRTYGQAAHSLVRRALALTAEHNPEKIELLGIYGNCMHTATWESQFTLAKHSVRPFAGSSASRASRLPTAPEQ
ncbi:hypothetical protein BDQ17DRAFT_1421703 [Cyathus striatus]|nr:hypothetical protein BDQ17DRAFT_1421703 [Cyathus striatus]